MEEKTKQHLESIAKSAFGTIPYAGSFLNEILFDYHSRIKQDRLNKFTELLSELFSEGDEIDLESLRTEEFADLFEAVLRKVVRTKSTVKLKRFRDILANYINSPNLRSDDYEIYLEIVAEISETDLQILFHHQSSKHQDFQAVQNELNEANQELNLLESTNEPILARKFEEGTIDQKEVDAFVNGKQELAQKIEMLEDKLNRFGAYRKPEFYNLNESQFLYSKQKLYSKGLMIDSGIGAIGVGPFQSMSVTVFGSNFLEFVMHE